MTINTLTLLMGGVLIAIFGIVGYLFYITHKLFKILEYQRLTEEQSREFQKKIQQDFNLFQRQRQKLVKQINNRITQVKLLLMEYMRPKQ